MLAVGVGGTLADLLDDVALRVLPIGWTDVEAMLRALRAVRCSPTPEARAGHLGAVVDAVLGIASLASSLTEVHSSEVNPLLATPAGVEALDVLVTRPED